MTDQRRVIPQYTVRHWAGFPWLSFPKETSLAHFLATTSKYVLLKNLASVIHQALERLISEGSMNFDKLALYEGYYDSL